MLSNDGGMWVTVDFRQRIFGLGYARPRAWRESMCFSGRDWRRRLLDAAVEHLQQLIDA
jgi:hypothetical protein